MKNSYKVILTALLFAFIGEPSTAQSFGKTALPKGGKKISSTLFGLFFEDINYSADGGLYAELIQNRSFEYSPNDRREWHPFSFWEYITPGFAYGNINVETNTPLHPNNPHYIVLNVEHTGTNGVGVKNTGFGGIVVREGEKYNLSMFARQLSDSPLALSVSLQSPKGKILAESELFTSSKEWKKYTAQLTATVGNDTASLVILVKTKGKLSMDVISLFPEKTFKNRPNGLRADLAQALADMKPKFIRFPGGCLVHGDGLGNMYRWKNTIGPIEQRLEQKNIWNYHQTMGLGYYEYFQFCEDIGALPIPVLPAGVSCQNSGGTWAIGSTGQQGLPMEEMATYIQEVLDLIEWANGPVSSAWGAKRAAAGHPEPFHLKYVGIGNEDKMTPVFEERFKIIYEAVKAKHPEITVIGTVGPFPDGEEFNKGWEIANKLKVPIVDEHYYCQPSWFNANQYRYDKYDRKASAVYIGEFASWGNKLFNAISEAAYMTSLERNGDIVKMASYAPLLAKKGFTQWNPDMIYFDNTRICPTANYYVQQMFSANQGDIYFDNVVSTLSGDSTIASSCVMESQSGDVILKLVNRGKETRMMKINLPGIKGLGSVAEKTILSGDADATNTFDNPDRVVPVKSELKISKGMGYECPAMSLTVIRIKNKK